MIKKIWGVICWPWTKFVKWLASGYLKIKMNNRFCKKCNHLCHCIEADHSDCKCENCECMQREEDKTYETGGVVIDSTQDCEACE